MAKKTEKKIPLAFPVEWEGEVVDHVTLHRPRGKDLRAIENAEGGELDQAFVAISRICRVSMDFVDEMDAEDITTVGEALEDFLPGMAPPATGDGSSQSAPST